VADRQEPVSSKVLSGEAFWDGERVQLHDAKGYARAVKAANWPVGKALLWRLSPATRSDRANAYYWSTVLPAIERGSESGHSAEELHDAFCEMFILTERKQVEFHSRMTGETISTPIDHRRSSALSGQDFYDFVEQVREFARTFFGVETPDPDPNYWRKKAARSVASTPDHGQPTATV
jgi:hypothetical protein